MLRDLAELAAFALLTLVLLYGMLLLAGVPA